MTRPPSWSIRTGSRRPGWVARRASVRARELGAVAAVAAEQDDAGGRLAEEEGLLLGRQLGPGDRDDGGADVGRAHYLAVVTMHWPPWAWMAVQAALAAWKPGNGPAWRR